MDDTLETTTGKINAIWQKSDDHQVTLGVMMAHAKALVEAEDPYAEGMAWKTFVAVHFKKKNGESRSLRSVQQLLQIGHSPDPQAKADEIREIKRETARALYSAQKVNEPDDFDPTNPVDALIVAFSRLTDAQKEEFMVRVNSEGLY